VNQEESEHNEVDGMKKGVDSTGKVIPTPQPFTHGAHVINGKHMYCM